MPVYVYRCRDCRKTFEKRHGMFFEQKQCVHCFGTDIFKVPSVEYTGKKEEQGKQRTGKVVDEYIRDVKEEIKAEKKNLKSKEL